MIVDTSAVVAILKGEEEGESLALTILGHASRMSAGSYLELMCVLTRSQEPAVIRGAERLLEALGIEVVPVSVEQARLAAEAYRLFGRASGHPAGLNLGDMFAHSLAVSMDEPLLFTGDAFSATDVRQASTPT